MWVYLQDVFSETSDQARLFTVLITTLAAFFVVLVNQYIISRRERRYYLQEKSDALYKLCGTIMATAKSTIDSYNHALSSNLSDEYQGRVVIDEEIMNLIKVLFKDIREMLFLERMYFNFSKHIFIGADDPIEMTDNELRNIKDSKRISIDNANPIIVNGKLVGQNNYAIRIESICNFLQICVLRYSISGKSPKEFEDTIFGKLAKPFIHVWEHVRHRFRTLGPQVQKPPTKKE